MKMLRRFLSMMRKELQQVLRNAITLRLVIFAPVIQLLIFGYVAIIDVKNIPTAVLDHSKSPQSRRLLSDFENSGYFEVVVYVESESRIESLLDEGEVDLVIVIPEDFAQKVSNGEPTEVMGAIDGTDSNTAIVVGNYFTGVATRYAVNLAAQVVSSDLDISESLPFEARPRALFNPEMKTVYYLVPGIIAILVLMILVMLTSISFVRERERGTLEQLTVTPIRPIELVLGKTLPFAVIGYIDIILITLIGTLWFNVPIHGNLLVLFLLSGFYMLAAMGIGLFVSAMAHTQQQAMMLGMFFIIPQLLLSGFIFPIESMPDIMQWITYLIPARYFLIIIRGIFLKGVGIEHLVPETIALLLFAVILFGLAVIRFGRRREI